MRRVAVVGASVAGVSAARALRELGMDGEIVMVGAEPHRPYDRPPLSKEILVGTSEPKQISLLDEADDGLGLTWRLGTTATGLVASERAVELDGTERLVVDGVVVATGSSARQLPTLVGADGSLPAGVGVLRTLDDALALREALRQGVPVVVIGAGFIGLEVASAARALGVDVTVVDVASWPLVGVVGPTVGEAIARWHLDHGVELRLGVGVARIEATPGGVEAVELDDGSVVPAGRVVVGVGVRPCTEWLSSSGLELGDGVVCDAVGRTSLPPVVAVGDVAAWLDPADGRHRREEHWTAAFERPATAARALLGHEPAPPLDVPYFWSDQHGSRWQLAGRPGAGDHLEVTEGVLGEPGCLVRWSDGEQTTAVLALDAARSFVRQRRELVAQRRARLESLGLEVGR